KAKELIANAPSFYQILPSRRYYNVGGSFFINDDEPLTWAQSDAIIRRELNGELVVDANAFHTPAMDQWNTYSSDVAFRLIVGTGKHDTPGILKESTVRNFFGKESIKL